MFKQDKEKHLAKMGGWNRATVRSRDERPGGEKRRVREETPLGTKDIHFWFRLSWSAPSELINLFLR